MCIQLHYGALLGSFDDDGLGEAQRLRLTYPYHTAATRRSVPAAAPDQSGSGRGLHALQPTV